GADRQQAAMHFWMQRLDAAVHHLGRAGQLGDVEHFQPCVGQCFLGTAGRDQLDAVAREGAGEVDEPGLVGNREEGALDAAIGHATVVVIASEAKQSPLFGRGLLLRRLAMTIKFYSGSSGSSPRGPRRPVPGCGVWVNVQCTRPTFLAWPVI